MGVGFGGEAAACFEGYLPAVCLHFGQNFGVVGGMDLEAQSVQPLREFDQPGLVGDAEEGAAMCGAHKVGSFLDSRGPEKTKNPDSPQSVKMQVAQACGNRQKRASPG